MFIQLYAFICELLLITNSRQDNETNTDIDTQIINVEIPDIVLCQSIDTDDCSKLINAMVECQKIVFNDPGFSYQQYLQNIQVHRIILDKYQSTCEGRTNIADQLFSLERYSRDVFRH